MKKVLQPRSQVTFNDILGVAWNCPSGHMTSNDVEVASLRHIDVSLT